MFVEDVVSRTGVGSAGYAYVTDGGGRLVAHPDINLVRTHANFSSLPQVRSALVGSGRRSANGAMTGRSPAGKDVLSAFQTISPLGWRVFVEQPLSVAYRPLESALVRTALLLVAFLILAVGMSVLLARRMVRPIKSMQAAAAQNRRRSARPPHRGHEEGRARDARRRSSIRMAARLQESYAGLEVKVEERTRELEIGAGGARRRRAASLRRRTETSSTFLANMSHEILTPLNAIIGFSRGPQGADVWTAEREAGRVRRRGARLWEAPAGR